MNTISLEVIKNNVIKNIEDFEKVLNVLLKIKDNQMKIIDDNK